MKTAYSLNNKEKKLKKIINAMDLLYGSGKYEYNLSFYVTGIGDVVYFVSEEYNVKIDITDYDSF